MNNTTCNYCKQPIEKGVKSCPHCGTLNPSVETKEIFYWIAGMVVGFYMMRWFMG